MVHITFELEKLEFLVIWDEVTTLKTKIRMFNEDFACIPQISKIYTQILTKKKLVRICPSFFVDNHPPAPRL